MLALFHDAEYVLAWTLSTPAATSWLNPLNHVRMAPAPTASTAFGSASARLASGALGLSTFRSLQPPAATNVAMPTHWVIRWNRIVYLLNSGRRLRTRARTLR